MPSAALVLPGELTDPTGGSTYDRRIVEGLRARGWTVGVLRVDASFPKPSAEDLASASSAFDRLRDSTTVVVDGLTFGAIPEVIEAHAGRLRFVALIHLPLAETVGLDADTSRRLELSERRALAAASAVVVTGAFTATTIAGYGVPRQRIALIEPGMDRVPLASGSGTSDVHIACVASVTSGKGHDLLVRALGRLRHLPWKLTCVGSLSRDPSTVAALRELIRSERIEERVVLSGSMDANGVAATYARSDLFVLATLRETYCMAVSEAVAHGLPVVSTSTGAIPQLVGVDGGIVVSPGDLDALTGALERVLGDDALRARFRAGAGDARARFAPWDVAVDRFEALLTRAEDA